MQMLFVDESGTPPPPNKATETSFFVLGGIVIPENIWLRMAQDLAQIKRQYGISGEIKWRYFAPEKPGAKLHSLSHLSGKQKEEVRIKLYSVITSYKAVRLICVVTNVISAYKLPYVNNADDVYGFSYRRLIEHFQDYLEDLEKTASQWIYGIVVCDHRAPKEDMRLRELHHELMASKWESPSIYWNLIEGLFIAPSHLSVGVQFADMVAGAVFRAKKAKDTRFFEYIRDSFKTSPQGHIEKYGMINFPSGDC